jgi:hypothetical protein
VKSLKRSGKIVVLLVMMSFLVLVILGFNHRVAQYRQLAEEAERLEVSVTMLQRTQIYLETQVAYATSEASVEQWAYQDGRWIREGDHLVVPYSSVEQTPTPRPQLEATPQALATWEIWRMLFFEQLP